MVDDARSRPEGGARQGRLRPDQGVGCPPRHPRQGVRGDAAGPRRVRLPGAPPQPRRAEQKRDSEKNLFGTEFPWAQGDLTADGKTLKKVGVRYAGDVDLLRVRPRPEAAAQGRVRPVRRPDVPRPGRRSTCTRCRSTRRRRARRWPTPSSAPPACPPPRTAFAEVTLTVPGKYDKEYLGLYTVVEQVDKQLPQGPLRDRQGPADEAGSGSRGLDYLGDDWERYKGQYRPQSRADEGGGPAASSTFARLVNQADDERVPQGDRLVPRRGRVPALPGRQRPASPTWTASSPWATTTTSTSTRRRTSSSSSPATWTSSLANFLLMGTPDQLMDLSLTQPVPRREQAARPAAGHQGGEREVPEAAQGAVGDRASRRSGC